MTPIRENFYTESRFMRSFGIEELCNFAELCNARLVMNKGKRKSITRITIIMIKSSFSFWSYLPNLQLLQGQFMFLTYAISFAFQLKLMISLGQKDGLSTMVMHWLQQETVQNYKENITAYTSLSFLYYCKNPSSEKRNH